MLQSTAAPSTTPRMDPKCCWARVRDRYCQEAYALPAARLPAFLGLMASLTSRAHTTPTIRIDATTGHLHQAEATAFAGSNGVSQLSCKGIGPPDMSSNAGMASTNAAVNTAAVTRSPARIVCHL